MSEQQIAKFAGVFVEHQRHLAALSNEERQWAIQNMPDAISLFCGAIKNRNDGVAAQPQKLLELLMTVKLPAIGEFKAEEKFVVDTGRKAKVKIAWLGNNFQAHFGRKVEQPVASETVKLNKLLQRSVDRPIIDEAGGEEKVEISLGQFYETLWFKQMRNDRTWIITYVRDDQGVLWAVIAYWNSGDGGWNVNANSVEGPDGWDDGSRVVSR